MKKYKALKDISYWGIKAGEVYDTNGEWVNYHVYHMLEPLLEAGIIEEVPERLTVEFTTSLVTGCALVIHIKCKTKEHAQERQEKILAFCKELDAKNE